MQENWDRKELASERTLLAAERTFSAWIRTGLAALGGGLADAQCCLVEKYNNGTWEVSSRPTRKKAARAVKVQRFNRKDAYEFKNYAEACKHFGLRNYRADGYTAKQELERRGFLITRITEKE